MYKIVLVAILLCFSAFQQAASAHDRVVDLAGLGNELTFLFPSGAEQQHYRGSILASRAILYEGGTLDDSDCTPYATCGIVRNGDGRFEAEFPDKVIGHATVQVRVVTDEMDKTIASVFTGDTETFMAEAEALSGRIVFDFSAVLNFNHSLDHLEPGRDKIMLHGYVVWGVKGQKFTMAVTGGTGRYRNMTGEAVVRRLIVANATGANSFRIKLPKIKY